MKFTTAISKLSFVQALGKKEQGRIYAKYTNQVYMNLQDIEMSAKEYKKKHGIPKREIAKHYFKKNGLLNLEEIENGLSTIVKYIAPTSESELDKVFEQYFESLKE